jgi:flagellar basal body P-ring formation protein FlgA
MPIFVTRCRVLVSHTVYAAMLFTWLQGLADAETVNPAAKQDMRIVRANIETFLAEQTASYPGKVTASVGSIDSNVRLTNCADMQVFLPSGSRAWGNTSVAVRCNAPVNWTIYIKAKVSVAAPYWIAATALRQGHVLAAQDLMSETGDLTQFAPGLITEQEQAIGRVVSMSMNAGTVLRQEMLKAPSIVQQGQTVMVNSTGKGFSVSAEGQALSNAAEGQIVQVKVASGQVIRGLVKADGKIEVSF